ncbi:hypothetical protein HUU62_10195 [Rhodoferax sp. 4810]|uniref:PASTA domain-containing protein n=1 Tax=Thiospirillum jenense TaxID=1653858 RepID=A0A839HI25_9GAMM|nr:PASTA domain-containing protein [Thiospirillum jenense]MBB1074780.1 hypothetical protein [Rhodoferax jenense]MBB1126618.1 hypothetical protein [Thiospirillum jenense]
MKKLLVLFCIMTLPVTTVNNALADDTVVVPKINGECGDVDQLIKRAGLRPKAIDIHGPIDEDAGDIGCAYRQRPKAGTRVKKGSTVTYRSWWEAG